MTTLTQKALLNKIQSRKKDSKGFTLIELLITVVILGVLSAIALPAFLNQQAKAIAKANDTEAMAEGRACAASMVIGDFTEAPQGCSATGGTFTANADATKTTDATATVGTDGVVTLTASTTL